MRITVHIERLILDGVQLAPADAAQLREALERDLARLVRRRGLAPALLHGGAFAMLTGPAITLQRPPEALAEQVAGAVSAAIGKTRRETQSKRRTAE
ncbi:hypothetical protein L6Q96_08790 [Candidatus Binatia bacterium]|nr:hypothetical protein [Candidatus Binatia bacterium]